MGVVWIFFSPRFQRAALLSGSICLIALLALTREQISHWQNSETLFEHAIRVTPDNYLAENNIGFYLLATGQFDRAKPHLLTALQIKPDYPEAHYNLGVCLIKSGEKLLAVTQFREALKWRPDYQEARAQLDILDRESQR